MKQHLILLLIFLALAADAVAKERVALVIGNAGYENIGKLENPYNDATKVVAAMERLDFDVVKAVNVTRDEMIKAIKVFRQKLKTAKVGVLFYAGHGVQVGGKMYLMPVDAGFEQEEDLEFDSVNLQDIIKTMKSKKRVSIIFVDACRNNPLSTTFRDVGNIPYTPDLSRATRRKTRKRQTRARVNRTQQSGKGQYGSGEAIFYATSNGALARDGLAGDNNSPYTKALLKYLEKPNLPLTTLIKNVSREINRSTKGFQEPWISQNLTRDFYFNKVASLDPLRAPRSISCLDEVFHASDKKDERRLKHLATNYKNQQCGMVAQRQLNRFCNAKKEEVYEAYVDGNLKFIQKFIKRYNGTQCAIKIGSFVNKLRAKQQKVKRKTTVELCRQDLARAQRLFDFEALKSLRKKYPRTQCARAAQKSMVGFCIKQISSAERWGNGRQIRRLKLEFAGTACEKIGRIALENICTKRFSKNQNRPAYLRKLMQEYPRTRCVQAVKLKLAYLGNRKSELTKSKNELARIEKALAKHKRVLEQRAYKRSKQAADLAKRKKQLLKRSDVVVARLKDTPVVQCQKELTSASAINDIRKIRQLITLNDGNSCSVEAKRKLSRFCSTALRRAGKNSQKLKLLTEQYENHACARQANARLCLVNAEDARDQKDGSELVALSRSVSNPLCAQTAKKYATQLCEGELKEAIQKKQLSWLEDLAKRFETTGCAKTAELEIASLLQKREFGKQAQLHRQEMYQNHKEELRRVGCYTGKADGKWDGKAKQALKNFLKLAKLNSVRSDIDPNSDTLASLLNWQGKGYACPFFCQEGEFLDNYGMCKQVKSKPVKKLKSYPLLRKKLRSRSKVKRKAKSRRKVKRKAKSRRKVNKKAKSRRKVNKKAKSRRKVNKKAKSRRKVNRKVRSIRKVKKKVKTIRKVKRKVKPIRKVKRKVKPIRKVKRKVKPIRKVRRKVRPRRKIRRKTIVRRTPSRRPTIITGIR